MKKKKINEVFTTSSLFLNLPDFQIFVGYCFELMEERKLWSAR